MRVLEDEGCWQPAREALTMATIKIPDSLDLEPIGIIVLMRAVLQRLSSAHYARHGLIFR